MPPKKKRNAALDDGSGSAPSHKLATAGADAAVSSPRHVRRANADTAVASPRIKRWRPLASSSSNSVAENEDAEDDTPLVRPRGVKRRSSVVEVDAEAVADDDVDDAASS